MARGGREPCRQLVEHRIVGASCEPLRGALVEAWHADAEGVYSGYDPAQGNLRDAAGETFLRGYQVLVFQEDTIRAVDRALARVPEGRLLDQVLHIVGAITAQHGENRDLARVFVREVPFLDDRRGVADFMVRVFAGLIECVEHATVRGESEPDGPAALLARNLFAIYFQHLNLWLRGPAPELDARDLRDALELQVRGLRIPAAPDGRPSRAARSRPR